MGLVTGGCPLSQPRLLSLLDTWIPLDTTGLSTHPARQTLCTFGDAGALWGDPRAHLTRKVTFESRDKLCQAPQLCTSRCKPSHAHPSPAASTAPHPSTCQTPEAASPPSPLQAVPTGVSVHRSSPACRRGAGSVESASCSAAIVMAVINSVLQLARVQHWRQPVTQPVSQGHPANAGCQPLCPWREQGNSSAHRVPASGYLRGPGG